MHQTDIAGHNNLATVAKPQLEKAGFKDVEVSVVSREAKAPHFQTVLATARK